MLFVNIFDHNFLVLYKSVGIRRLFTNEIRWKISVDRKPVCCES